MKGNPLQLIQYLYEQDKTKIYEVKEYKPKKTDNQRKYCWELINEIANVLRINKDDCYITMLERYSQREIVSMLSSINPYGYFKYYKEAGKSVLNDKEFTHYHIFKGLSEMDTKEASIFIDGVVSEAKELNIPTLTPNEIANMRSLEEDGKRNSRYSRNKTTRA